MLLEVLRILTLKQEQDDEAWMSHEDKDVFLNCGGRVGAWRSLGEQARGRRASRTSPTSCFFHGIEAWLGSSPLCWRRIGQVGVVM